MSTPREPWQGPVLPLPGGVTMFGREANERVDFLMRFYLGMSSANNGGPARMDPLFRAMREAVDVALKSGCPDEDSRMELSLPQSRSDGAAVLRADDLIGTAEVAKLLLIDPRHARRLVAGDTFGPAWRIGRGNFVSRAEVLARRARRDQEED